MSHSLPSILTTVVIAVVSTWIVVRGPGIVMYALILTALLYSLVSYCWEFRRQWDVLHADLTDRHRPVETQT